MCICVCIDRICSVRVNMRGQLVGTSSTTESQECNIRRIFDTEFKMSTVSTKLISVFMVIIWHFFEN